MTKAELRKQIADRKQSFFQSLEKRSTQAVEKLQSLERFQNARTIGAYMPLADEVDITPLFKQSGKSFFIPSFDKTSGGYRLAKLTPELLTGRFGIPEPTEPILAPEELDLILVPGVAFDRAGNRLGRGGGFYDRLLPQYRAVRVGICFDFQCLPVLSDEGVEVENIPAENHDCKIHLLITESEILEFAMNS